MLRCVQEEVIFETLDDLLLMEADDPDVTLTDEIKAYRKQFKQVQTVTLTVPLHIDKYVDRDHHGRLVHQEVLLSWGEVLRMFAHCFPSFANSRSQDETKWGIYQHALQHEDASRYHYWSTDSRYPVIQRGGTRRRRDTVRVNGVDGQHLAEIVCFVKAQPPSPEGAPEDTLPAQVGVLVRWFTPHEEAIMYNGEPTCAGQLCHTHNLWSWHRTAVPRTAISGYRYGRLSAAQKKWLSDCRPALMFASYDIVEFNSLGKYANVSPDFDRANAFLESVSWA